MSEPRILLGSVHAPPEDPLPRLLVTRRWPASIDRRTIDQWEPDLAPSVDLEAARDALDGATFEARYRAELAERANLVAWAVRMAGGTGVVLLGEAENEAACHRGVLAAVIRERLSAAS